MTIAQGNPLPRIVLPVGFEPRAVRLDISGMRAAGTCDSRGSQYSSALGKFRMVRIAGRPCDGQLPSVSKLPSAKRAGKRLEIVVRGLRGGIGVCLIWMPVRSLAVGVLLQDVQGVTDQFLCGLILAAGKRIVDKLREICW